MLNVEFLWYYLLESRANPLLAAVVPPPYSAQHPLESTAVLLVQCFYIHNIWSLSAIIPAAAKLRPLRAPLSLAALLLALVSFAGGIAITVETTNTTGATRLLKQLTVPGVIQPLAALLADAYITAALCWTLRGARTGLRGTEGMVATLTTYAVNRGVLTSTFQLLQLATYLGDVAHGTFVVDIFSIPGSTLYVNSLLAVLNARHHLRARLHLHSDVELAPAPAPASLPAHVPAGEGTGTAVESGAGAGAP